MSRRERKAAAQSAAGAHDAPADETTGADDETDGSDSESTELAGQLTDFAAPLVDENGNPVNPPDAVPGEGPGTNDHGVDGAPAVPDSDAPADETAIAVAPALAASLTRYRVHAHGSVQHNDVEYAAGSLVELPPRAVAALIAEGILTEAE